MSLTLDNILLACLLIMFGLVMLERRQPSAKLHLINAWLRWVLFSMVIGQVIFLLDWFQRPYWVMAGSVFLVWFAIETFVGWIGIRAVNHSEFPLFPRFRESPEPFQWPASIRFIAIKQLIESCGFERSGSLRAHLFGDVYLNNEVYDSVDKKIRLQIHFLPLARGGIEAAWVLSSETESGQRIVTDNLRLPYGGFYPDNWRVKRKPLVQSFSQLLKIHKKSVQRSGETLVAITTTPEEDVHEQQQVLELVNMECGFITPVQFRDRYGKITPQGRYRVWKESWMMKYFGYASR